MLDNEMMECSGISAEGTESVCEDRLTARLKLEDGGRIERLTCEGGDYAGYMARKEDTAMKYRWEKITDTTDEGTMYLYKNMQDNVICYVVPVMPFRDIVPKHGAYGLCVPGMGIKLYESCGKLLRKILRRCMPEDVTEAAENIKEMMAVQDNGFDTLWYIMSVYL